MTVDVTPLIVAAIQSIAPIVLLFLAHLAYEKAWPILSRYIGQKDAAILQDRVDRVLKAGIGFAVQKAAGTVQDHGAITVDTKSWMVGMAVQYATSHAPDLMAEAGQVTDKVLARFDTHPAVQGLLDVLPAGEPAAA